MTDKKKATAKELKYFQITATMTSDLSGIFQAESKEAIWKMIDDGDIDGGDLTEDAGWNGGWNWDDVVEVDEDGGDVE